MELRPGPLEGVVVMNRILDDFYCGKKVMITGHTGFKGSWLALWLKHLGADVSGYALHSPTNPSIFDLCHTSKGMTSIYGDIRDFRHLHSTIQEVQPEIIFHMAAQSLVRRSYIEPVETYSTNIMGTVHLLETVRQSSSVKAVIIVSSDKCYENREWVWGYRENDIPGGDDPYSSSKGCCELITAAYQRSYFNPSAYNNHGLALASVRAGNVIGGGDWAEDRLIPDCIRKLSQKQPIIIRSPGAVRPWQHVLEPLSGYLLIGRELYLKGESFSGAWNFGPDYDDAQPVSWIVSSLITLWGNETAWKIDENSHPHEANILKLDCSKAKTVLNWKPNWNLEQALEKTASWYKSYFNQADMLKVTLEQICSFENTFYEKAGLIE